MSDTPIWSALTRYAVRETLRMHMPGHKGKSVFPAEIPLSSLDVTELADTGCLYDDTPPFSEANRLAAGAWGVPQAMILAGGATLGIQAMLRHAFAGSENRRILVDRGSHKSVYHALAFLDLDPTYLRPDQSGREPFETIGATFSPAAIDRALAETRARAVILTTPTYYGTVHDIAAIAAVVHRHGALLLVDEAHGAHFPFTAGMSPATSLGADIAVCSLHKTLPALTGAALLTASVSVDMRELSRAAAQFGSSSPSFLIAASADCARAAAESSRGKFSELAAALAAFPCKFPRLSAKTTASGLADPLRLTVCTSACGLAGSDAAKRLDAAGVTVEMSDRDHVVAILSSADSFADLERLFAAMSALPTGKPIPRSAARFPVPTRICSPREAWMAPGETVPTKDSVGRVAAETVGRYPPGIPLVAPGEAITAEIGAIFAADPDSYPANIRVLCRSEIRSAETI